MIERSQMTVSLSNEAIAVLSKHATDRKRGEFISRLILNFDAMEGAVSQIDIEAMKLQQLGIASQIKSMDSRTTMIEKQLAALIAKVGLQK